MLLFLIVPAFLAFVTTTVVGAAANKPPLFEYEVNSLTDEKLSALLETELKGNPSVSALFRFGSNGSVTSPDRLKTGACKVFPGDANWPSLSVWDTFNGLLRGALIKTVPLAAVCYDDYGVYNAEKCAAVRDGFTNQYTQFVSLFLSHFHHVPFFILSPLFISAMLGYLGT